MPSAAIAKIAMSNFTTDGIGLIAAFIIDHEIQCLRPNQALQAFSDPLILTVEMVDDGKKVEFKVVGKRPPIALGRTESPAEQNATQDIRLDVPLREASRIGFRKRQPGVEVFFKEKQITPRQVEDEWQPQRTHQRLPWGWFTLIGTILCGAVVWSVLSIESARPGLEQLREETIEHLAQDQAEVAEATRVIEEIERSIRAYFAISSPEILGSLVRHPKRVQPLINDYYGQHTRETRRVKDILNLQPITLGKYGNFWWATLTMDDGSMEMLVIEMTEQGEARIDWESHVCHQPMPWDEFVAERPIGRALDFRVMVEPIGQLEGEAENATGWPFFRLTTRDAEEFLTGYAAAASTVAADLDELFQKGNGNNANLILRLIFPDKAARPREVVIEKIVNERWIYLDDPETP